jgi:flagellar motor switch protein FliM
MREHQKSLLALVRPMITDFEKSWLNIAQVELNLNRVTIYPYRAKVMLPYEYCLVFCIKLSSGEFNSNFTLCMPLTGIDPLLTPIEKKKLIEPESMEYYFPHVKKHFNDLLDNTEYSVVAELGTTDLSGTHGKLEEGQVLPLENRDGNVTIRINGTPALKGTTGESDGNYSVRVIRGIDDKKPSSIQQKREFKQADWAEN